jgi:methylthioribose-1-phosphate isomerase
MQQNINCMNINGIHYRTIWVKPDDEKVIQIIDQRYLPHQLIIEDLKSAADVIKALREMHVRGAGLIGATAGYGMYMAALEAPGNSLFDRFMDDTADRLKSARPTAVNLSWAVEKQLYNIQGCRSVPEKTVMAFQTAHEIAEMDVTSCRRIGEHGVRLIEEISRKKGGKTVNILTHCNAGWLAFVDHGTATSPIYLAAEHGIDVHVWVDETRPRNQGASLTAWELGHQHVPYTVITDNAGGHLMQHGLVDMVIVGSDRATCSGDVANKIGTYLKALAALDNQVPFYVALPSSTIDWTMEDGIKEIPIEERGGDEVKYIEGRCDGEIKKVLLTPENAKAANYGFDVTPARLITGLITERGICQPTKTSIMELFPERNR